MVSRFNSNGGMATCRYFLPLQRRNMSEILIQNETFTNLLNDLQVPDYIPSANAQALLATEARYIKDLKINTGNVLNNNQHLTVKEAALLALAVAVNERFDLLKDAFTRRALAAGATKADIAEIIACTSLMNTNNIFYRFRHFMQKDGYNNQPAGIKRTKNTPGSFTLVLLPEKLIKSCKSSNFSR